MGTVITWHSEPTPRMRLCQGDGGGGSSDLAKDPDRLCSTRRSTRSKAAGPSAKAQPGHSESFLPWPWSPGSGGSMEDSTGCPNLEV